MAPKKTSESLVVGTSNELVGIEDGPNDWDLWLSFRGTISKVVFFLDSPIVFPQPSGSMCSFFGRITMIAKAPFSFDTDLLAISGYTLNYPVCYKFTATYCPRTRKGTVRFEEK